MIKLLNKIKKAKAEPKEKQRYKENPFIAKTSTNTKIGQKRISTNKTGDKLMIMSQETGEIIAPAGFHHIVEVDKTEFVKLFKNGVKAFKNLSPAGYKVFSVLYDNLQDGIGKDEIDLLFIDINQDTDPMSSATFYRGLNELIEGEFLASTLRTGRYFINPDFVFNGNRLAFIKEFRLKATNTAKDQIARQELEDRGQQRLDIERTETTE
jgi:hypothetical protein